MRMQLPESEFARVIANETFGHRTELRRSLFISGRNISGYNVDMSMDTYLHSCSIATLMRIMKSQTL